MEDYSCLLNKITIGSSKSSKCKKLKKLKHESDEEIENTFELKCNKNNKYEKIEGNLFKYEGTAIHIIYEDAKPWFRGKDIATVLQYKDTKDAISHNVDKKYIKDLGKFKGGQFPPLKGNAKMTKYINKKGLFALIMKSKMEEAQKFQEWVMDLLEKIDNNESIGYDNKEEIQKDFEISPSNEYQDWGLTNNLTEVKNKRVIYLGAIGVMKLLNSNVDTDVKKGEMLFKYGITSREDKRYKEHNSVIESYVCFHVRKCMRNDDLERDLEDELKRKGLRRHLKIGNNNYTELFVISPNFTIDDIKMYIDDWIEKNDYKLGTNELELAKELTKQKELDVKCEEAKVKQSEFNAKHAEADAKKTEFEYKKMELEYKMSQEKKLECNTQKIKK